MARLTVKHNGVEVGSFELKSGQEYIAGRAPECDIKLGEERGISRQHLKLFEREGVWICETLSKYLPMQIGNNVVEVVELTGDCDFTLPPYTFSFAVESVAAAEEKSDAPAPIEDQGHQPLQNPPAFIQPRITPKDSGSSDNTTPKANNEATVAGSISLIPYIRIGYPNTADDEVLKLEGAIWVAGREPDCEIHLDSPHVSRRHFELARTAEGFFITDLGSSNGSKVNGVRVPAHEPTKIESGDEIVVMNIRMVFEIRDSQFSRRVDNLPVPAFDPMLAAPMPWYPPPSEAALPQVYAPMAEENLPALRDWKKIRPRHLKKVNWKKNKV
ncbi:MAG: FHA domain-containing protein, partial [Bdellovibrionales bacterium]